MSKNNVVVEEKNKKTQEKSKVADRGLKDKKDLDEMQKRKDVFRMEDLDKGRFSDEGDMKRLEELID